MNPEVWKFVGKQLVTESYNSYTVSTFERYYPHGVLVMVVTGYGDTRATSMQFIPNPPATEGVYR